ncbi:hypothetical protein [Aeromonas hydrophila]|uniref:hypothetical protein n=1 Tax=Aeromonas hydrophila TaxID=644 RepID=UPI0004DAFF86|nr:hypothetical protein [Aeromonas hydrophila]KER62303.1 hypothetical protein HR52_04360 [Aeromonas hydrophila]OCA67399.1 hypothetical protein A9R12_01775 [Aeromonas hydrophila]CAD7529637.1 hypothetical protein KBAH04_17370 [Aeromonas hydrophila]
MTAHTKGLLATFEVGDNGNLAIGSEDKTSLLTIVDEDGTDFAALYHAADARRIVACWNLLHEFDTEAIEAGTFADFIGKQVYLHEIENANSGELRLSDVSLQLMAAGFAGKMKANAADNYMEFGLFHPDTGPITITVQRVEGLTPAQKLAAMTKQRDVLLEALNGVLGVMNNSEGVAGWHKNGDIATWDELLPEVAAALEFVEGEQS